MCGIFGYVTPRVECARTIVDALRKLEYRGYDSWGVGVGLNGHIAVVKRAGRIPSEPPDLPAGPIAFGHTRWATHGAVTDSNAHPHLDCSRKLAVIHNGIIENFRKLRSELERSGHHFRSETDSEVFAHLVEECLSAVDASDPDAVVAAVRCAFGQVDGLNAFIVLHHPTQQLIAVKSISPLVIGSGTRGTFVASDAVALVGLAEQVHYLDDDEMAAIRDDGLHLFARRDGSPRQPSWRPLTLRETDTSLEGFPHYLIKEIHEQPRVIERIVREHPRRARELARWIECSYGTFFVGCGTAGYAALAGSYLFSRIARRHVNAVVASEFKYQEHFLTDRSLVIALSQSGETVDVIEAVLAAKRRKARVAALVNVSGSTLERLADLTIPLLAGPEQSVLSTKAYTAKLALLLLTAHVLNGSEHVGIDLLWRAIDGMVHALTPNMQDRVKALAERLVDQQHCFIIGRGLSYPTALEAALKIKEVSYLHAEGFAGGELKHGVIALVEPGVPCVVFSPLDETRADILSGAMELRSRGGWIIGVSPEDEPVFDVHLPVAEAGDASCLVNVVPAQLLGYYLAVRKGLDPDKPRNLAKSVTVK